MAKQKKNNQVTTQNKEQFWGREIEYSMPKAMFDSLTEDCKGDKVEYAINYINETYGLLGHVTSLVFV